MVIANSTNKNHVNEKPRNKGCRGKLLSKGIDAGIANGLTAESTNVIIKFSFGEESEGKTVTEIVKYGEKAISMKGRRFCATDSVSLLGETVKTFRNINILFNSAGAYAFSLIESASAEYCHHIFEFNVLGGFLSIKEAINHIN